MQKEQHGDCVVLSVPCFGLSANPLLKSKDGQIFFSLWWNPIFLCVIVSFSWKQPPFRLKLRNEKVGCRRFETKNVHKELMRMWNRSGIKSYGTSTGRYALHGKRSKRGKTKTKDSRWKCPEMTVDGQDLTWCGGCQGYMDFFSEVFCVVSFFFFFFNFLHTKKHQDGKHFQRLKERTNTQCYFPKCRFSQSTQLGTFLNVDIREGNSPSLER